MLSVLQCGLSRGTFGHHRCWQILLMRKITIIFFHCKLYLQHLISNFCGWAFVAARRLPLETTVHFRLLNTDERDRNKGPDEECSWFFLLYKKRWQSSRVIQPHGCAGDCPIGVGRCWTSSVPAASTDCGTCWRHITGSRSSCSPQSSPDSSGLVSWALAGSLWPPNASLLFCQKEVLMLLMWRFRVEICLGRWVAGCSGCSPVLLPSPWASCHTHASQCQRQSRLGRRGTPSSFHSPRWGAN